MKYLCTCWSILKMDIMFYTKIMTDIHLFSSIISYIKIYKKKICCFWLLADHETNLSPLLITEMSVWSQESEWSSICVLGGSLFPCLFDWILELFWQCCIFFSILLYMIWWFWCSNATFSNISAISWRPVLVVEEAGVPGENHRP